MPFWKKTVAPYKHEQMKAFFKDIFTYHYDSNLQLMLVLETHETQLSAYSIPMFSHTINAHHIWNARIRNSPASVGVHEVHTLKRCRELNHTNHLNTLAIIEDIALHRAVTYRNTKGVRFVNTIQEILFHIANHFTHHKGQIISDLRKHGISPPATDYIFYKR